MEDAAFVYILASGFKHLYIGVTSELQVRVSKHKKGAFRGSFTEKHNIHQLVYYERWGDINMAITREKQLKRWSRIKKIRLIVSVNPDWKDLSLKWEQPLRPFQERTKT